MPKIFIGNSRVYLRPFERGDVDGPYSNWVNDPEVSRYLAFGSYPLSQQELYRYFDAKTADREQVFFAIVEVSSENCIGTARISSIDWINRKAQRGIMIGEKSCWGRGYGREVINLLSVYAFETLNLRKLISYTVGNNAGIIKVNEACGYKKEGILREEFFRNGVYHDVICWGLLRSCWGNAS